MAERCISLLFIFPNYVDTKWFLLFDLYIPEMSLQVLCWYTYNLTGISLATLAIEKKSCYSLSEFSFWRELRTDHQSLDKKQFEYICCLQNWHSELRTVISLFSENISFHINTFWDLLFCWNPLQGFGAYLFLVQDS